MSGHASVNCGAGHGSEILTKDVVIGLERFVGRTGHKLKEFGDGGGGDGGGDGGGGEGGGGQTHLREKRAECGDARVWPLPTRLARRDIALPHSVSTMSATLMHAMASERMVS